MYYDYIEQENNVTKKTDEIITVPYLLLDLKGHIDYFSKGPKSNRTDRTQNRKSFQANSILSFRHNDKHEKKHVGQMISIKGHII